MVRTEQSNDVGGKLGIVNAMERSHPHQIGPHTDTATERAVRKIEWIWQHTNAGAAGRQTGLKKSRGRGHGHC